MPLPDRSPAPDPPLDCKLCSRLVTFREANRAARPKWHNAPVPSFGATDAKLLIVGLAPGLRGANRTGLPFIGDDAGDLLYRMLIEYGWTVGNHLALPDGGMVLRDCLITNAVRCVPPHNKPTPAEIGNCRSFLVPSIGSLPRLRAILVLGRIAHDSTLKALGCRLAAHPFAHGARHAVAPQLALLDSFHCSRYNINTGRLTLAMFKAVFDAIRRELS